MEGKGGRRGSNKQIPRPFLKNGDMCLSNLFFETNAFSSKNEFHRQKEKTPAVIGLASKTRILTFVVPQNKTKKTKKKSACGDRAGIKQKKLIKEKLFTPETHFIEQKKGLRR